MRMVRFSRARFSAAWDTSKSATQASFTRGLPAADIAPYRSPGSKKSGGSDRDAPAHCSQHCESNHAANSRFFQRDPLGTRRFPAGPSDSGIRHRANLLRDLKDGSVIAGNVTAVGAKRHRSNRPGRRSMKSNNATSHSRGEPVLSWLLPTASAREYAVAAVYVGLAALALAPAFLVEIIPVTGFVNHMARVHILANYSADPLLQQAYAIDWAIKPNLALDIVLPPLTRFLPLFDVGKLFFAVSLLALAGGTAALHRALHGKVGLWPAVAFLFLYNQIVMMGFLNYAFGLGMALFGMTGWVVTRKWPTAMRITAFTAVATALFFTHLMSLGIYGLFVAAHEFSRALGSRFAWRPAIRDWLIGAAQFALPAVLLIGNLPPPPENPYQDYGGIPFKIYAILSPVLAYHDAAGLIIIPLVFGTILFALLTRRFRLAPDTGLCLALLGAAGLASPFLMNGRFGGVWGLDVRIFVALAFVAIAAIDFQARGAKVAIILGFCAVSAFGARIWEIGAAWTVYDVQVAEYRAAAAVIEPGAVIMQAQNSSQPVAGDPAQFPFTYWYLATLSVIDRSVFVPTLYTDPKKQPVVAAKRFEMIDTPAGLPVAVDRLRALADPALFDLFQDDRQVIGERMYGYMWQDTFRYVVVVLPPEAGNPVPELLDPVAKGSYFTIYRVRNGGCLEDYPRTCKALRGEIEYGK